MKRSRPTIYRVKHWVDAGKTVQEWAKNQQDQRCKRGRHCVCLTRENLTRVKRLLVQGYNPDVIAHTHHIGCSARSLYRLVARGVVPVALLPWKGKRRENHVCKKRGQIKGAVSIHERLIVFPQFYSQFGLMWFGFCSW